MIATTSAPFGPQWIAEYFAEVDRRRPEDLLRWYGDDASFRFAGEPRVVGKAAIAEVLATFYRTLRAMRHERTGVWVDLAAGSGVWEAEVHFETADGRSVVLPAVSVLRLRDGLVSDFRFVMDAAPLRGAS